MDHADSIQINHDKSTCYFPCISPWHFLNAALAVSRCCPKTSYEGSRNVRHGDLFAPAKSLERTSIATESREYLKVGNLGNAYDDYDAFWSFNKFVHHDSPWLEKEENNRSQINGDWVKQIKTDQGWVKPPNSTGNVKADISDEKRILGPLVLLTWYRNDTDRHCTLVMTNIAMKNHHF